MKKIHKIVLTGGPGGGKTTAAELYRREFAQDISIVPEVATILFRGGYPRSDEKSIIESTQKAIYHVQVNIEETYTTLNHHHILLCDRGTIDGAAYWPGSCEDYFKQMGTTYQEELNRYDAVIFFETAAAGGLSIRDGNSVRIEDQKRAIELDKKLKTYWEKHPNFIYIKNEPSFLKKVMEGILAMQKMIKYLHQNQ